MPKAILFKVNAESLTDVVIDDLDSIYSALECECMDFSKLSDDLGVYVDDNGLLVDDPNFGLVFINENSKITGVLAGNILFVNHDDQGETIDLTEKQINLIKAIPIKPIEYADKRVINALIFSRKGNL